MGIHPPGLHGSLGKAEGHQKGKPASPTPLHSVPFCRVGKWDLAIKNGTQPSKEVTLLMRRRRAFDVFPIRKSKHIVTGFYFLLRPATASSRHICFQSLPLSFNETAPPGAAACEVQETLSISSNFWDPEIVETPGCLMFSVIYFDFIDHDSIHGKTALEASLAMTAATLMARSGADGMSNRKCRQNRGTSLPQPGIKEAPWDPFDKLSQTLRLHHGKPLALPVSAIANRVPQWRRDPSQFLPASGSRSFFWSPKISESTVEKALPSSRTGAEERSRARIQQNKERVFKAAAESCNGVWVASTFMGLNTPLNAFNRRPKLQMGVSNQRR
ncbi:hypothetical protein GGX14DRAFT_384093 [Mycena pura]|uniref:Uncharacterized protein n=1 Tax=Mycena pura TaxID=153505 RepID=A0AAD7E5M2_9AGAR|nr:hypothetical protein GGX14DRAFT_384093 [Mycena pura]